MRTVLCSNGGARQVQNPPGRHTNRQADRSSYTDTPEENTDHHNGSDSLR